ncbi:MAG: hypothetical protein AABZ69_00040, partial [Candidatus Binatota bacterium]
MRKSFLLIIIFLWGGVVSSAVAQSARSAGQAEWEKVVEAAKKEGRVVASIPPSPELRKGLEEAFTKRFGIAVESVPAR